MQLLREIERRVYKYGIFYPTTRLLGQKVFEQLGALEGSQYWEPNDMRAMQEQRLNSTLQFALDSIPNFQQRHREAGEPELLGLRALQQIPAMTKADLLASPSDETGFGNFRVMRKTTGGSTGVPVTLFKSPQAMAAELGATWRCYRWIGLDIGDRQLRFWGGSSEGRSNTKQFVKDILLNRRRCSAFDFGDQKLEEYLGRATSFAATYFYGYASMLVEFARYAASNHSGTDLPSPLAVISTSEVLPPEGRKLIEQTFNTRVFNEYGCGEVGSIAHECPAGSLHLMEENLIVEILDGDRVCDVGEVGEIVVTELNNRAQPLIRYRMGDYAAIAGDPCPCGRRLRTLSHIVGRSYDMLINRSGKKFHGEFFMYILEDARESGLNVLGMQIQQISIDHLQIRLVCPRSEIDGIGEFFAKRIRSGFDENIELDFSWVPGIERERSGKMRLIVGLPKLLDDADSGTLAN